jgi:uncharacterized protein (DUF1499 family)
VKYLFAFTLCLNLYANETYLAEISSCLPSPNCKSSLTDSENHKMVPWQADKKKWKKLKNIILKMPRTKLVKADKNFYHFVFTSAIFRFKDDVYFYYDDKKNLIHFKSASRIGYSDLGTNEKRLKNIKKYLFGR